MRASTLKWTWAIVFVVCLAGAVSVAFVEGARFGRLYERFTFDYAAPKNEAVRGALGSLLGRQKSYSQFGQDLWIVHGVFPGKRNGFYVDVGSGDGEYESNTKLLDDLGWKGVCIDPFPQNMSRRTCQMFTQPVLDESGKHVQFRSAGLYGGIETNLNRHKTTASQAPLVDLVTATLDEILAKAHAPRDIDFMSIDVEGAEYDVLRGLSFDRFSVGSFTIEHNYEAGKRDAIHKLLAAKGYVLVRSWWVDDWYVRRDLAGPYGDFISYCPVLRDCSY